MVTFEKIISSWHLSHMRFGAPLAKFPASCLIWRGYAWGIENHSVMWTWPITPSLTSTYAILLQFDDPKDKSTDPKIVNMNIRKRVMKGAPLLARVHGRQAFSIKSGSQCLQRPAEPAPAIQHIKGACVCVW